MSSYLSFPPKKEIFARLWEMDSSPQVRLDLYRTIAERLDSKTYDSAAFAFLLIETLHQFEGVVGEELTDFLPRCVLVLTEDQDLARSAREALEELSKPPGGSG